MGKKVTNPNLDPQAMSLLSKMGVYYDTESLVLYTKLAKGGFNSENVSEAELPNKVRTLRRGGVRLPSKLLAKLPYEELSPQERKRVNAWKKRHNKTA